MHRVKHTSDNRKQLNSRIFLSSRPGRSNAGSNVSGLFVAMIILTLCRVSNPSIWFSNWRKWGLEKWVVLKLTLMPYSAHFSFYWSLDTKSCIEIVNLRHYQAPWLKTTFPCAFCSQRWAFENHYECLIQCTQSMTRGNNMKNWKKVNNVKH